MNTTALTKTGDVMPEFLTRRFNAIMDAIAIESVTNDTQEQTAVQAQLAIKRLTNEVESERKAITRPLIDLKGKIDAAAKEARAELDQEFDRISGLVGDYAARKIEAQRAEERRQQAERDRIERERIAELQRIQDEENARIAAEKARIEAQRQAELAAAKTEQDKLRADQAAEAAKMAQERAEAERKALAEQQRIDAEKRAQTELSMMETKQIAKPQGQTVREEWEIVVSDIYALARHRPDCVRITPLMQQLKDLKDSGIECRGVTYKRVVRATVNTRTKTIDA